ncbi:ribosomal protein P2 [Aspergillus ruber CBS 135680]|uniref:Putative 60s acidic ribosomal protein P2-a n=1 Tax=Aspergillus ruber (strain CBS 135680) TaxID=1388766 RepID=A0A017SGB0_ASPRC|nr:putative 60s acidic ribosomal protein P2-a [Aspergillus ruber CBS 135680]EYE95674.1 putative 60s acidic ribosomal protein P2-a [Aspergillus ruber CBS 135680]
MKHLAAYLLIALAGNATPSADDVKGVLSSVGVDADEERLQKLISELEGKDINEGTEKLASVPSGGAGAAAAPAAGGAGEAAPAEKKEEEPAEESDDDMGLGLFD